MSPIVDEVRKEGDEAVRRFTEKFDRVKLDSVCVRIEVRGMCMVDGQHSCPMHSVPSRLRHPQDVPFPTGLAKEVTDAFDVAYSNIKAFHEAQRSEPLEVETMPGVRCRRVTRPIGECSHQLGVGADGGPISIPVPPLPFTSLSSCPFKRSGLVSPFLPYLLIHTYPGSVGIYVPGGTAVLPSSALMMAVPAKIAGCATIVLATPPRPDGSITPEVLYCAKKAGVTHILKAGGAQVGATWH